MRILICSIVTCLSIGFFSLNSNAANLSCEIKLNNGKTLRTSVSTILNKKMFVGELESLRSFVTEKPNNFFSLEVFLGGYEARVYSEGFLRNIGEVLNLSYWSREVLLDLQCKRIP